MPSETPTRIEDAMFLVREFNMKPHEAADLLEPDNAEAARNIIAAIRDVDIVSMGTDGVPVPPPPDHAMEAHSNQGAQIPVASAKTDETGIG